MLQRYQTFQIQIRLLYDQINLNMAAQIILQQIDVMVLGPKKFQFLSLVLDKQFQYSEQSSSSQSNPSSAQSYTKILKKFFSLSTYTQQNTSNSQSIKSTSQLPSSTKEPQKKQEQYTWLNQEALSTPIKLNNYCGIHKFTKMIETQSFWITLNFYVTDLKIYDPILSQYTRGNIQIGIVVGDDQTGSMEELKTYFSGGNNTTGSTFQTLREPQKNTRAQSTIEAKINSRIHSPSINGFTSLLCLKLRDDYRLIEQSNNLRLNNNQIFRWIVDRYFQNKYRIKLRQCLGDQIERGKLKQQHKKELISCRIM